MPDCPTCGLPYKEGEKFCNACGGRLPVLVKQKVCPVCGNTLFETSKKCSICGTPVTDDAADTTAQEIIEKKKEEAKNPSMDEVQIPVITDEMLGLTNEPQQADMPTMDSIYMPGQEPPKPKPPVQPTPVQPMQQTMGYQQQAAPQQGMGFQQQAAPQQNMGFQQQAAPQQNMGFQQPDMPQNNFPQNNFPVNNGAPEKGSSSIVPIILIIAIIAVILVDVFVLFREQIFGKKSSSSKSASIVTVIDSQEEPEITIFD